MNSLSQLLRALRGPVMLTTFGTLLAVDQAGGWPWSRTWPVLVIIYGAMRLLEVVAPKGEAPPPPTYPTSQWTGTTPTGGV